MSIFFFASILNTFAIITVNEIITLYIKLKICEPISLKMVNFNFISNQRFVKTKFVVGRARFVVGKANTISDSWNKVHNFQFAA